MNSLQERPLVIVMPVYEEREASSWLFGELADVLGEDVFLVVIDDGSVREPLGIDNLKAAGLDGVILKLRRNVGHQGAIAVGLSYVADHIAAHQRVVVMDSDGEDVPESIPELLAALEPKDVDVAVAERKSRVERGWFKVFYAIYKGLFRALSGRSLSFGNFVALKPHAVRRLVAMQETAIHLAASVIASKLRISVKPIDRGPRRAGHSKMNFVGLVLHGFRALMVFAEDVLLRVGLASAVIATASIAGIIGAIFLKSIGFATPGWFSVALGILVLMLMQTGALALMTLMLTGVIRGGLVTTAVSYKDFVESIVETTSEHDRAPA